MDDHRGHDTTHPVQRLRHELRGAPVPRPVAPPRRPLARLHEAELLDLPGAPPRAGRFDGLFIADVLGTYDVYGGNHDAALRNGTQTPVGDPILLVSAMAAATEHLGFGITAGTAYEHPYPFARRMSTLDHLTNGRVGWNVVTGLPAERRAQHGRRRPARPRRPLRPGRRVPRGALQAVGGLVGGRRRRRATARPASSPTRRRCTPIGHEGTYYKVPGIHVAEPSPQRTPVIYQAGASPRGIAFAAGNAEAIFVGGPDEGAPRRDRRQAARRPRGRGSRPVLGADLHAADRHHGRDVRGRPGEARGVPDVRLARGRADPHVGLDGRRPVDVLARRPGRRRREQRDPVGARRTSRRRRARAARSGPSATSPRPPASVGSDRASSAVGEEIADQLQEWVEETDVDGFNLAYAITPGTFEDIVEHVVPVLQARGAYPTEYEPAPSARSCFGRGDRLPEEHHGSRWKVGRPPPRPEAQSLREARCARSLHRASRVLAPIVTVGSWRVGRCARDRHFSGPTFDNDRPVDPPFSSRPR